MAKCITCGFAAKRTRVAIPPGVNREYFEIPFDERQRHLPVLFNDYTKSAAHTASIACFRGKVRLEELAELRFEITCPSDLPSDEREGWRSAASNDVLEADRPCEYWYQYEPGRSPQEHLADFMWEQLAKLQQELDERLSARAETVQLQLAERDEQLQTQRDREQGRNARLITRITLVGILIAFAQVLTLTKDSVLWKVIAGVCRWLAGQ